MLTCRQHLAAFISGHMMTVRLMTMSHVGNIGSSPDTKAVKGIIQ